MDGGACIYCGKYVEPRQDHNFCFTKRYIKKTDTFVYDDWCHYECYRREYDHIIYKMTDGLVGKLKDEPKQLTLWEVENGFNDR